MSDTVTTLRDFRLWFFFVSITVKPSNSTYLSFYLINSLYSKSRCLDVVGCDGLTVVMIRRRRSSISPIMGMVSFLSHLFILYEVRLSRSPITALANPWPYLPLKHFRFTSPLPLQSKWALVKLAPVKPNVFFKSVPDKSILLWHPWKNGVGQVSTTQVSTGQVRVT